MDSNILDTADVQDGPEKHGKKITETNIENKNKSNSETPVLVYRHVSLLMSPKLLSLLIDLFKIKFGKGR